MDSDKLKKVNKALKIAVNLVKPDQAGYEALLEAKDIVEKELQNPSTSSATRQSDRPFEAYSFKSSYGSTCVKIKNGRTCRQRFSEPKSNWCDVCILADMFR